MRLHRDFLLIQIEAAIEYDFDSGQPRQAGGIPQDGVGTMRARQARPAHAERFRARPPKIQSELAVLQPIEISLRGDEAFKSLRGRTGAKKAEPPREQAGRVFHHGKLHGFCVNRNFFGRREGVKTHYLLPSMIS